MRNVTILMWLVLLIPVVLCWAEVRLCRKNHPLAVYFPLVSVPFVVLTGWYGLVLLVTLYAIYWVARHRAMEKRKMNAQDLQDF